MESLDSILKGKEAPAVEQPKAEAKEEPKAETPAETPEQKAERERDERGRFKAKEQDAQTPAKPDAQKAPESPKVETKPAPTAAETAKPAITQEAPPQVPVKALQEERRKRQELERQLQALQQPQKPAPDVLADPAGFQQHIQADIQTRETNLRVNMSAAWAKKQYPDFDSVMETWFRLKDENPALYQQAIHQDLPAEYAYQHAKRHLLLQEIGDPNEYRSKLEKELREKLESEISQKYQQQPQRQSAPVPPPSLANASSGAAVISTAKTFDGPTPFQKIIRS